MSFYGRFLTLVAVIVALCSLTVSAWCDFGLTSTFSCPSLGSPFNAFTCSSKGSTSGNTMFTSTCTTTVSPSSVFTCSGTLSGTSSDNVWLSSCTLPSHAFTCTGTLSGPNADILTTSCTSSGSPSGFTCTATLICPTSNYNFLSTSECESITSANTCNSNSNCTWCTSAAVGNSCVSKDDAASLPTSIFTCGP